MTSIRKIKRSQVSDLVVFAVVLIGSVVMLYPLLWMLSSSLKANKHIFNTGLIPKEWHFENYLNIWGEADILKGLGNSLIITLPIVVCSVITASMAAFAFAKLRFKGKNIVFFILLGSTMIPFAVIMLPQFILFKEFKLLNGPFAYILPRLAGGAFTIFFLRQYLYGVPDSIIESAKIDGAGFARIFFKIVFPLMMPAVIAQLILGFIGTWSDYLGPLMFIRNKDWLTLPLIISRFNSGATGANNETPMLMAAAVISMLPVLVIFGIFQKKIVNSIMTSGIKL